MFVHCIDYLLEANDFDMVTNLIYSNFYNHLSLCRDIEDNYLFFFNLYGDAFQIDSHQSKRTSHEFFILFSKQTLNLHFSRMKCMFDPVFKIIESSHQYKTAS